MTSRLILVWLPSFSLSLSPMMLPKDTSLKLSAYNLFIFLEMTYEFTIYVQYLVKIRKIILYAHFDTVLIGIHEQWWNGQHLALFDHWMVDTDTQAQQPANKKFWFKVTFFQENEMGCHIYKEVVLAVLNCVKPMRWLISLSKLCTVQPRPIP